MAWSPASFRARPTCDAAARWPLTPEHLGGLTGGYDSRGKALYRAVLPFHKVWSLEPFAEGVQINGSAYAERVIIVR